MRYFYKFVVAVGMFSVLTCARAAENWPKTYYDLTNAQCVERITGADNVSRKVIKAISKTCACMTDRLQQMVTYEKAKAWGNMSQDELDALPETKVARSSMQECSASSGLTRLLDAPQTKLTAKGRETLLIDCALEHAEAGKDLADGRDKVAKACTCFVDAWALAIPSYKTSEDSDRGAESILASCKAAHLN